MSLRSINLKFSYETGSDDLVEDFYIPVLSQAVNYDRIAGFFSSSSLAVASKGISSLIERKGHMRLITCQRFSPADAAELKRASKSAEEIIARNFIEEYDSIEDGFEKDHVSALGWMLANDYLELRIALVKRKTGDYCSAEEVNSSSIMHQKVGIIYDEEFDAISFSGSINESANGWQGNVEEFKVFKEWEDGQRPFFTSDRDRFLAFWENKREYVETIPLPIAVERKLIEIGKNFDMTKFLKKSKSSRQKIIDEEQQNEELRLYPFQEEALQKWIGCNRKLLIEMATGCGKTRTSLGCLKQAIQDTNRLLCVIACPQTTLSQQWKGDVDSLDIPVDRELLIDGGRSNWLDTLQSEIRMLRVGYSRNLVVFVTHAIACKEKFLDTVGIATSQVTTMIIADEVHGLGSREQKRALSDAYRWRIGLSATPDRWFDTYGTKVIKEYFEDNSYSFSIRDALSTMNPQTGKPFLVQFYYYPRFVSLTEEELEKYRQLTKRIVQLSTSTGNEDTEEKMTRLLFRRADIEKAAENKYACLSKILDEIGADIQDTIIFVSPEQIDRVMQMLTERGIIAHRFTQSQGTTERPEYGGDTERQHIIKLFKEAQYQVLVAIKCLDEGIDIPSAKRAIIMASSTNPREFIQRVGRVIRQAPGKERAFIYDLIIRPSISSLDDDVAEIEKRIFRKEMDRVFEMSGNALNGVEVTGQLYEILDEMQ